MALKNLLTLSLCVLCMLNFFTVEAYIVLPIEITGQGISLQALRWDSYYDVLYFADTEEKTIHRFDPDELTDQVLQLDQRVTFIAPLQEYDYSYLVTMDRDLVYMNWDYDSSNYTYFTCLLVSVQIRDHGNRWNTGELDGYGNFWGGTLTIIDCEDCYYTPPNMYRALTTRSGLLTADVAIQNFYSNGIEFTVDYRVMYTIDYYNRQIYSFNFNLLSSTMCCPQVIFRYRDYDLKGYPDSITKDTDGNLWIGSFNGSQVIQINPNTCELLQTVDIPTPLVTSVEFGGDNLDTLYVGTMQSSDPLDLLGGYLYEVCDLGVTGVPEQEAVINSFCRPIYF